MSDDWFDEFEEEIPINSLKDMRRVDDRVLGLEIGHLRYYLISNGYKPNHWNLMAPSIWSKNVGVDFTDKIQLPGGQVYWQIWRYASWICDLACKEGVDPDEIISFMVGQENE